MTGPLRDHPSREFQQVAAPGAAQELVTVAIDRTVIDWMRAEFGDVSREINDLLGFYM